MSFDLKIQNGDLSIKSGELQKVENTEKLIQDILKICLTTAGSNPIIPWYGSFLPRTVVGNPMYSDVLVQISKSQLSTALENLKNLQTLQVKSMQRMSAAEQLAAILEVSVIKNALDPRIFSVGIRVMAKDLRPVNTNFSITT